MNGPLIEKLICKVSEDELRFYYTVKCMERNVRDKSFSALVLEEIANARLKNPVAGIFGFDVEGKAVAVKIITTLSIKDLEKEKLKSDYAVVECVHISKKEFSQYLLEVLENVKVEFSECIAEEINTLIQKRVECDIAENPQWLGEEVRNYWNRCRKEEVCKMSYGEFEKAIKCSKEEKVVEKKTKKAQKAVEKMVTAPLAKHLERMEKEVESSEVTALDYSKVEETIDSALDDIPVVWEFEEDSEDYELDAIEILKELEELDEIEAAKEATVKRKLWAEKCQRYNLMSCENIVGTSNDGNFEIVMRAIGNGRQRKYNLYEREAGGNGRKFGFMQPENFFKVSEIKREPVLIGDRIDSFYGDYRGRENKIKLEIMRVESTRMLDIFEEESESDLDSMIEDLQFFMISNPLTQGIVHIEIKGVIEVGIIGDKERYRQVFEKAVPGGDLKRFNEQMKAAGKLKVTGNEEYRYTRNVEKAVALREGWSTPKFYNFDFSEDFVKEYIAAYNRALEMSAKEGA